MTAKNMKADASRGSPKAVRLFSFGRLGDAVLAAGILFTAYHAVMGYYTSHSGPVSHFMTPTGDGWIDEDAQAELKRQLSLLPDASSAKSYLEGVGFLCLKFDEAAAPTHQADYWRRSEKNKGRQVSSLVSCLYDYGFLPRRWVVQVFFDERGSLAEVKSHIREPIDV